MTHGRLSPATHPGPLVQQLGGRGRPPAWFRSLAPRTRHAGCRQGPWLPAQHRAVHPARSGPAAAMQAGREPSLHSPAASSQARTPDLCPWHLRREMLHPSLGWIALACMGPALDGVHCRARARPAAVARWRRLCSVSTRRDSPHRGLPLPLLEESGEVR